MRLALVGFGTVGQGLAEAVAMKKGLIRERLGTELDIVAVFDSKTYSYDVRGLDPLDLVAKKMAGKGLGKVRRKDIADMLGDLDYDVLVEMTPTNIVDAKPGYTHMCTALKAGKDVVTSNKGPLALKYRSLDQLAKKNGVELRFEATVGGATPIINLSRELLMAEKVESMKGILNGTCNFILSRMGEEGLPFEYVLKEAQEMGYAETDPSYDIDGIDSASKLAILANAIMGLDITYHDVRRTGIRRVTQEAVDLAAREKKVIRLIGEVNGGGVEVCPRMVPLGHPLSISGTLNVLHMHTDLAGAITVVGRGAGRKETASAIMSDLVGLMKRDTCLNGRVK
ncbi:MAG: homoserine dehydrogenase [Methanomassiliicoccales archaeon]|nr:homoserine dehydrogenase [Methanomassiliicoccales archaeon]